MKAQSIRSTNKIDKFDSVIEIVTEVTGKCRIRIMHSTMENIQSEVHVVIFEVLKL